MGLYERKKDDTKVDSLILATLSLIGSILAILLTVNWFRTSYIDVLLDPLLLVLDPHHKLVWNDIILYVCIAVLCNFTLVGLSSSLLIHGIRKDCPGLMLPYLVLHGFLIAISITLIVTVAALFTSNTVANFIGTSLPFYCLIGLTGLQIWFQVVINAHRKKLNSKCALEDSNKEGTVYKIIF